MNINDRVPETKDGIQSLYDSTQGVYNPEEGINNERIVAGIQYGRAKKDDILEVTLNLRNSRGLLERELFRLAEFAQMFNKLYATKNNKWFSSAEIMLKKIQSHYLRWRDMLKLTSPRRRRKKGRSTVEHSIYETSMLNKNQPFVGDMFGIASYGELVADLKMELEKFLSDLVKGIKLCQTMLNEEEQIKERPEWIKEIYEDCYNMTVAKNRETIDWLVSIGHANTDNQLYQLMLKYKDKDKFIQEQFHENTDVKFNDFVFTDIVMTLMNNNINSTEQTLWGRDYDKIRLVRFAIEHFDQLVTPHGRKGYSGPDLLEFIVWCDVHKNPATRDDEERILYDYLKENYKGCTHIIGWTSVFDSRKSLPTNSETLNKIASEFDHRVKELYDIEKQKEIGLEGVA
ncbi:MAG: hypothetical protein IJ588_05145 [Prevotella sp.]|nr:hypothetical protein [Prevotella sp.]